MQIFSPYQKNPKCSSKMWNYSWFKSQIIKSTLFRNRNWINEDMFGMSSRIDVKLHSHKRHKVYYTELRFRSTRSQKTQVAVTEQMLTFFEDAKNFTIHRRKGRPKCDLFRTIVTVLQCDFNKRWFFVEKVQSTKRTRKRWINLAHW